MVTARNFLLIVFTGLVSVGLLFAQEERSAEDCTPEALAAEQSALFGQYPLNVDDPLQAQANLFDLSAALQELALSCGYQPSPEQASAQIGRTLQFAGLPQIIEAMAVGDDVEQILIDLETVNGDSFNGQLLYNGLEPALDGTPLTCSSCHLSEAVAPPTEGTWTRITEERLQDPALEGYDARHYIVESILHPDAYVVPGYTPNLMPAAFGFRLDLQQLEDLIAYLESQDQ
ncbi:MAG: cytochrome c [Anaerolineae bacterium]|nr:cytochrome c [Anaerolineae bacterium]